MIKYTLSCDGGHSFEGWFSSSADFDRQAERGLVSCPACGSVAIGKELMAPSVSTARRKDEAKVLTMDKARREAVAKIRELVTNIRENSEDVGTKFPEEARKIHYGEAEQRGLIGQATMEEARALIDEGIEVAALPVLPDDAN
ncbi:DUF1178 family protein [Rhizobium sp. Root482]|uniref:DUF1178 family protein n=1 Tax=Rhizobium sp. Root482 TaxID=1736543 RepID=UPI0006F59418|nr:DUF1178 family protein [Rhizobium sp. Root482]KQY12205.1 hypothetical protein ASD31_16650 [Rhizobium sp. Root482]